MSLTVRQSYAWQQFEDEKYAARAHQIPGLVHFVVPGAAATHFTFVKNRHKRVYTTVALALADCVASRGDAIVLLPGAHTVATASLAMSKAGVSIWGPEAWTGLNKPQKPSASLTTSVAADQIMNITAADCAVIGVNVVPITQAAGIDFSAAAHRLLIQDCFIDMATPAVHASTAGIDATGAAQDVVIQRCVWECDGASGAALDMTATINSLVEDCEFIVTAGTWVVAVTTGAATTGLRIRRPRFVTVGAGVITFGVSGTGATISSGVLFEDGRAGAGVTKMIDNYDAAEAELVECYQASIGGGSGGVLITAIT